MDRWPAVEPLPQLDFENTKIEDADETARYDYIAYSERNFTDFFDITNSNENQQSSSSDIKNKIDLGSVKMRPMRYFQKERKQKTKWSLSKPKSKLKMTLKF